MAIWLQPREALLDLIHRWCVEEGFHAAINSSVA
jgi:hypothetical protein